MVFSQSFATTARTALVGIAVGIGMVAILAGSISWFGRGGGSSSKKSSPSRKEKKSKDDADIDNNDEIVANSAKRSPVQEKSSNKSQQGDIKEDDALTSNGFTVLKLTVPKDSVGAIIGRKGVNIKEIQGETRTKIDFDTAKFDAEERVVTIKGSEKGAQDAELRILHIVYGRKDKESHKIQVPQGAVGYIIGAGGESIKLIQAKSNCRVKVDPSSKDKRQPQVDITLTGNDEQVASAAELIGKCVSEWESKMANNNFNGGRRPPSPAYLSAPAIRAGSPLACEVWPATADYIPCYVTAHVNPSEIWVQFITSDSAHLESINSRLFDLYSDSAQLVDDVSLNRFPLGTIVAAKDPDDDEWFRGRVSAYREAQVEGDGPSVDIYFVDYGDSYWLPLDKRFIQLLRPEFYTLPAQAVKCLTRLYSNPECTGQWTDELCDAFEKLAYVGTWRQLMGCRLSWTEVAEVQDKLPVISLVDTNSSQDVDIVEEMWKLIVSKKKAGDTTTATVEVAQTNDSAIDNNSHSTVSTLVSGADDSREVPSCNREGTTPELVEGQNTEHIEFLTDEEVWG